MNSSENHKMADEFWWKCYCSYERTWQTIMEIFMEIESCNFEITWNIKIEERKMKKNKEKDSDKHNGQV